MYTPNYIIFFCTVSPRSWEDTNVSYFFIKLYWDFKKIRVEFYEKKKRRGKQLQGWAESKTDVLMLELSHTADFLQIQTYVTR